MIHVSDKLKGLGFERGKAKKVGKGKTDAVGFSGFAEQLQQQVLENAGSGLRQELQQLKEALEDAGDKLEQNPTLGNLEVFRSLLSSLLQKVTSHAFRMEVVGQAWHPADQQQVVRVINKEAEELLELVLMEQQDRVTITSKIIHIKGLVVDLMS